MYLWKARGIAGYGALVSDRCPGKNAKLDRTVGRLGLGLGLDVQ